MPVKCVVGMHWGDEGKGGIIDVFSAEADYVVRCQGGANAGHTVIAGEAKHKFHLLPCGILREGVKNLIGHGVVLDLEELNEELDALRAAGIDPAGRLFISDRCQVLFPFHKKLDGLAETMLGDAKRGTSRRGIAPCYADKVSYLGVRLADMYNPAFFRKTLEKNLLIKNTLLKHVSGEEIDVEELIEKQTRLAQGIKPFVVNGVEMIHEALAKDARILVECAQGTLLDVDYGTYPYVSASNSSVHGVASGCGIPGRKIDEVVGVVKTYCTRVGAETGPFPTAEKGADGDLIRERGKEYGTTTGRPRQCGWLDLVATRYSVEVNDVDYIVLTLFDVLDVFEKVRVCVDYEIDGAKTGRFPASCAELMRCKPVYKELPGWRRDTTGARTWSDLPEAAQGYITFVEKFAGRPIKIISVGPERGQKVVR